MGHSQGTQLSRMLTPPPSLEAISSLRDPADPPDTRRARRYGLLTIRTMILATTYVGYLC